MGTRLRPLTNTVPKPLMPLANMPFVDRVIGYLASHGVERVTLALGYQADCFVRHIARAKYPISVYYVIEDEPLGTGGAVRLAAGNPKERVVVMNGDIFTDLDLAAMIASHVQRGADISISLKRVADPSRYGLVLTGADGSVLGFVEKPCSEELATDEINAGIYIFEPWVLGEIPASGSCSLERELFPNLINRGARVIGFRQNCYWSDLGTPDDYLLAHRDILRRAIWADVPGTKVNGAWIGEDVEISTRAEIEAPVVIGDGCHIAAGAHVGRYSVLGRGTVLARRARVERSVVWERNRLEEHCRVSGAILGDCCVVYPEAELLEGAVCASGTRIAAKSHSVPEAASVGW
jgi:mannose-1-phosphate guanylyltransferase